MKRTAIILSILVILGITLGPGIASADTGTITITVTLQNLAVSVTGGPWTVGIKAAGASVPSSKFTTTNTGNAPANLAISVADTTGGGATLWTAGAAVGANTFVLSHHEGTAGPPWLEVTANPSLATGLAAGNSTDFYLQLQLPSSVSGTGAYSEHTLTVTVTSSAG